jgi:hypothetical protein
MAKAKKVKWSLEADFLQACNCDYGCPCEFEAPPTTGYCDGMGFWRINKGSYGKVSLKGLGFGFSAKWPKAIHHGNGTAVIFIDQKAKPEQRAALFEIASGRAGGIPFEIIATTFSKVHEPQFVPFKFSIKGRNSSVKAGDLAEILHEPIKNPVTGEPEEIRVEHGTGFVFKGADCVSAKECRSSFADLTYSYPGKNGFISKVKYHN